MQFYSVMVACYCLFLVAWCILSVIYRKEIVRLQWFILIVGFCGLLEMVLWKLNYNTFNNNGEYSVALSVRLRANPLDIGKHYICPFRFFFLPVSSDTETLFDRLYASFRAGSREQFHGLLPSLWEQVTESWGEHEKKECTERVMKNTSDWP